MCEKFGTSGKGVEVAAMVGVGAGVAVNASRGSGVRVGREIVGTDSVNAGWQAEVKKEAMIVIHMMSFSLFKLASF